MNVSTLAAAVSTQDAQIRDLTLEWKIIWAPDTPNQRELSHGLHVLKGEKEYFEEIRIRANGAETEILAFDGTTTQGMVSFRAAASAEKVPPPEGWVRQGRFLELTQTGEFARSVAGRLVWSEPLMDALESGQATVQAQLVQVDGHPCRVVEGAVMSVQGKPPQFKFKYWLDPACGFMPRRLEQYAYDANGRVAATIVSSDYSLSEIAPNIWWPVRATRTATTSAGPGQPESRSAVGITFTIRSVNSGIDDDRFHIKFPTGATVLLLTKDDNPSQARRYIVDGPDVADEIRRVVNSLPDIPRQGTGQPTTRPINGPR